MAEMPVEGLLPPLERVAVHLSGSSLNLFEQFVQAMRWPADDAAKILLAYPLAIEKGRGLSPEQVRDELGASRAELATLRHRAFMADEAIRTLEMNVTGFTAAIEQFERLLPTLEQERAQVLARVEHLLVEAASKGVEVETETPEPVAPQKSLLDFFRHHRRVP